MPHDTKKQHIIVSHEGKTGSATHENKDVKAYMLQAS